MFGLGIVLFAIGLLGSVAIHEFGHFYPARRFGVRVSQFMVGFGPTLFSRTRGETEYGLKVIPLGGYVRMIGMIPPRPKLTKGPFRNLINQARESAIADLTEQDAGRAFYQLHPAKKLVVMLGGPVMNLITAVVLLFVALVLIGTPQPTNQVAAVLNCLPSEVNASGECPPAVNTSPAAKINLQAGDRILGVGQIETTTWDDLVIAIDQSAGSKVNLLVQRGDATFTRSVVIADISTSNMQDGFLGFRPEAQLIRSSPVVIFEFVWRVAKATGILISQLPERLSNLIATAVGAQPRDLEGPISIVGVSVISGDLAAQSVPASWRLLDFALLLASVNLALFFFNLLPILPLDGGHVLGALYEWFRRKTRSKRADQAVDIAKLMPVAYIFGVMLLSFSLLLIYVDLVDPIRLN